MKDEQFKIWRCTLIKVTHTRPRFYSDMVWTVHWVDMTVNYWLWYTCGKFLSKGMISKTMLYMVNFLNTRIYNWELQWWTVLEVLCSMVCKKCLWMCTRVTLWCIPYAMQYYMMNDGLTVKVCYWWLRCPKLHIQMKWIQYWMNNAYSDDKSWMMH